MTHYLEASARASTKSICALCVESLASETRIMLRTSRFGSACSEPTWFGRLQPHNDVRPRKMPRVLPKRAFGVCMH